MSSSPFSPPRRAGLLKNLIYKENMDIISWEVSGDCKALAGQNSQLQCPQCHENKPLLARSLWFCMKDCCSSCSGAAHSCVGPHSAVLQKMPSRAEGLSGCESHARVFRKITKLGKTPGSHSLLRARQSWPRLCNLFGEGKECSSDSHRTNRGFSRHRAAIEK